MIRAISTGLALGVLIRNDLGYWSSRLFRHSDTCNVGCSISLRPFYSACSVSWVFGGSVAGSGSGELDCCSFCWGCHPRPGSVRWAVLLSWDYIYLDLFLCKSCGVMSGGIGNIGIFDMCVLTLTNSWETHGEIRLSTILSGFPYHLLSISLLSLLVSLWIAVGLALRITRLWTEESWGYSGESLLFRSL